MKRFSLFAGILLGLLGISIQAQAACAISPTHSFINAGDSITLEAIGCTAGTDVQWFVGPTDVTMVAASIQTSAGSSTTFQFSTPASLPSGSNRYKVAIDGTLDGAAAYVVVGSPELTVNVQGAGTGTISSAPGGINNCASNCTAKFDGGSFVSLTPTPTSGSSFAGWGGDCSGTGDCTVHMTGARSVTASFSNAPQNGVCGGSNGGSFASAPSGLCTLGTPSSVTSNVSNFTWSCSGVNNGQSTNCSATRTYTVTPSAGSNGTISPNTAQTVAYGQGTSFTATPSTNYSAAFTSTCSGSANGNTYTVSSVASNCSVSVAFSNTPVNGVCGSANGVSTSTQPSSNLCSAGTASSVSAGTNSFTWSCAGSNGGQTPSCSAPHTYTVSASAGTGGSISPGSQNVTGGNTTSFTVTPNSGYSINTVTGCSGSLNGSTYTTGAVSAACTVTASFTEAVVGACGTLPSGTRVEDWTTYGTGNDSFFSVSSNSTKALRFTHDGSHPKGFFMWAGSSPLLVSVSLCPGVYPSDIPSAHKACTPKYAQMDAAVPFKTAVDDPDYACNLTSGTVYYLNLQTGTNSASPVVGYRTN